MRNARPRQFYPIYASKDRIRIPKMTWDKAKRVWKIEEKPKQHESELFPIGDDGRERIWSLGAEKLARELSAIQVRYDEKDSSHSIWRQIRPNKEGSLPSTWWDSPRNFIVENGAKLLGEILGRDRPFPFPKSPYAVADCLRVAGAAKKDALILDFFAGSGTTFQAVASLNENDGGLRRCIVVTNNEVADEAAKILTADGAQPGSSEWEAKGVCQSVTWPRCKFVTNGQRDDGANLPGDFLTDRFEDQEVRRAIRTLDFANVETLASRRARDALAVAVGFPKSKVTGEESFLLAEGESVAVLLDPSALDAFVEKGGEWAEGIETVYLPFPSGKAFNLARDQVLEAWPPLTKTVEVKRPMRDGFAANLDYFRLDFLDRSQAEISGKLADILPALWMMAGCRGQLPTIKGNEKMLFFKDCPFAVLVEESAIKLFLTKLAERPDIDWVFVVTHDQDSFARICEWLSEHVPATQRVHLWRNYVDNFIINVERTTGDAS